MIAHSCRRLERLTIAIGGLEALTAARRRRRRLLAHTFGNDRLGQAIRTILPDLPQICIALGAVGTVPAELPALGPIGAITITIATVLAIHTVAAKFTALGPVEAALAIMALAAVTMLLIAAVAAVVLLAAVVALLPRLIEVARLAGRLTLGLGHLTQIRLALAALPEILAFVLAEVIARVERIARHHRAARHRQATGEGIAAALAHLLLAEAHDDAVVVLGVLHVILRQHGIAGRQRITRQRHVFFSDMRRRAAELHIRARALEASGQRILRLAIAAATSAVLLSLPHWLPFLQFYLSIRASPW